MASIPPQPSANPGVKKDMEAVAALDRDAELMLRVREGDDTSFALLLERHRGPVVHFLYRMVQNPSVSEELAQEVFLRVYRSRATYEPTAKFTTWLFRITTNVALNWRRDTRREANHFRLDDASESLPKLDLKHPGPGIEELMMRADRAKEVREAVDSLKGKQLAAVLMQKLPLP